MNPTVKMSSLYHLFSEKEVEMFAALGADETMLRTWRVSAMMAWAIETALLIKLRGKPWIVCDGA